MSSLIDDLRYQPQTQFVRQNAINTVVWRIDRIRKLVQIERTYAKQSKGWGMIYGYALARKHPIAAAIIEEEIMHNRRIDCLKARCLVRHKRKRSK